MREIKCFVRPFGVVALTAFLLLFSLVVFHSPVLAQDKPIVLKMAHQAFPPTSFMPMTSKYWAQQVKEGTKGAVEVKIFYDTIAKGPEALSATQEGVADALQIVSSFISGRIKDIAPLEILGSYNPELFPETAQAIRPVMTKIFEKQNLKYLGVYYTYASLTWASNKKHYRTPADLKGQKVRIPGRWHTESGKFWGATPVMILPPELYSSMQRGIIDGVGTILELVGLLKLYEPGQYVTEWGPTGCGSLVSISMNLDKFNSLKKEYQDVIVEAGKKAELYSFDYGRKMEEELRKEMAAKAKYVRLTLEETQPFLDSVKPLQKEMKEYVSPLGLEFMDVLQKVLQQNK